MVAWHSSRRSIRWLQRPLLDMTRCQVNLLDTLQSTRTTHVGLATIFTEGNTMWRNPSAMAPQWGKIASTKPSREPTAPTCRSAPKFGVCPLLDATKEHPRSELRHTLPSTSVPTQSIRAQYPRWRPQRVYQKIKTDETASLTSCGFRTSVTSPVNALCIRGRQQAGPSESELLEVCAQPSS